jgi:hypothetical protein
MNIVTILRDLWRMRRAVACLILVALLAGFLLAYRISVPPETRKYDVGVASVRVLVDTPDSQVIAVSPKGSDTLSIRANLLASLVVDGVVKADIARRAGVAPNKIVGLSAASTTQPQPAKPSARGYALTTNVLSDTDGTQLPIIEIDAQAPDAAAAARLADAAVAGLRAYLDSQAAVERIPDASRLRVDGLGPAQANEVVRGPSTALAVAVVIFIVVAGCAVLLAVPAIVREWRAASATEAAGTTPAEPPRAAGPARDQRQPAVEPHDLGVLPR